MNPSRATIPLIRPHQCDSEGGRIRGVLLYNIFSDEHEIHIHNSQNLASLFSSSNVCGVVLECGCKYYGSSVDAAGGRGSVDKINSRWRRLPRVSYRWHLSH